MGLCNAFGYGKTDTHCTVGVLVFGVTLRMYYELGCIDSGYSQHNEKSMSCQIRSLSVEAKSLGYTGSVQGPCIRFYCLKHRDTTMPLTEVLMKFVEADNLMITYEAY